MKTSSVEFISRSPTPSPMERNYRRFALLRRIFQPWQWKRRKKRNRFEQTSRTLQRKISMRSTKDQLILLWSPWKYRCGQRREKETPNSTTLSKKIAQGNLTASCKRLISWFLLYKGTELGRKTVPVRPPKF
ncbi:phosphatase and actin regulator 2 [Trichonephila clavipes]|nr:phosphatase and actin regulator 2 [Trichonephila clavipes]